MSSRARSPKPRSTPYAARTKPRLGHCRQCFAPIFGCTFDALPLKLDPYPLTPQGELLSWAYGCTTFHLCTGTLWKRTTFDIKTSPTGLGGHILRTHSCGNWIPTGVHLKQIDDYRRKDPGF